MDGVILTNGRVRDLDPRWLAHREPEVQRCAFRPSIAGPGDEPASKGFGEHKVVPVGSRSEIPGCRTKQKAAKR